MARSPALFIGRDAEIQRVLEAIGRVHLALVYGVAGVGKSAFMLRVAESLATSAGAAIAYHRCRSGESVGSVVAALSEQVAPGARSLHAIDPVERVGQLATSGPLILCVDDAHQVSDTALFEVLAQLAAQQRSIYVLVASREALPISPLSVDHVICRLGPLGIAETRALWSALEQLYGPATIGRDRIDAVLVRGATPLVLKQIFAGQLDGDDVLQLGELPDLSRELLTRLCAFRHPVPLAALHDRADDAAAREAAQLLIRRFLVEPVGDRMTLHDVVRDHIDRSPLKPTARDHELCLAYYRNLRALRDVDQMERLYHAVGCGRDKLALAIISEHASDLRRFPPGSAVVERDLGVAIDALAERVALPPEILLFRQRIWARQGEVAKAYTAARAFVGLVPAVEFDLADMATTLGRYDEAIDHATKAAHDPRLAPLMRAFAFAVLADAHRVHGRTDRSREVLAETRRLLDPLGPVGCMTCEAMQAVRAFDHQRYSQAEVHLAASIAASSSVGIPFSMPLLAALERAVAAANGTMPTREPANIYDETANFRCAARLLHVHELLFVGDLVRAAELARATVEQAETHRFEPIVWWGTWQEARAARVLGNIHEMTGRLVDRLRAAERAGHQRAMLYLEVEIASCHLALGAPERARELAASTLERAGADPGLAARLELDRVLGAWQTGERCTDLDMATIEAAEGHDGAYARLGCIELMLWQGRLAQARYEAGALLTIADEASWRWIACRARIAAAEALYREGKLDTAEQELAKSSEEANRRGYEVDAFRATLLAAGIARARGDREHATAALVRVAARARERGLVVERDAAEAALASTTMPTAIASPGHRLARRLHLAESPTIRVVQAGCEYRFTPGHLAEVDWAQFAFGADLIEGRMWVGGRWLDLSSRGALLEMIRVLLRRPCTLVPVAELVREAWNLTYHPLRHHSRVTTTMSRVRKLLGDEVVQGSRDGYRLILAEPWFVVDAGPRQPARSGSDRSGSSR